MKITRLYPMTINTMNRPQSRESNVLSAASLMPIMVEVDTLDEQIVLYTPRTQNKHKSVYWDIMIAIATAYQRITQENYKTVKSKIRDALKQRRLGASNANLNNLYKTYQLSYKHTIAKYGDKNEALPETQKKELVKQLSTLINATTLLHSPRGLVFSKKSQLSLPDIAGTILHVDILKMLDELEAINDADEQYKALDKWMNFLGSSSAPFTFPGAWTFLSNQDINFFDVQYNLHMIDLYTYVINYLRKLLLNIIDAYAQGKTTNIHQSHITHLQNSYIALSFWMRGAKPVVDVSEHSQQGYHDFLEQSFKELQEVIQYAQPEKKQSLLAALDYLHHNTSLRQEIMFFTHREYWRIPERPESYMKDREGKLLLPPREKRGYEDMQSSFSKFEDKVIAFIQRLRSGTKEH